MPANKVSARELIGQVFDADSFESWDTAPLEIDPDPKYRAELDAAAEKSGADESVLTGTALLGGRRVAVIACEFSFLAGSIGVAAAERIVTAIERATTEGLPLLASPTSGGTRMQEGTVAFVQMVKIAAAIAAHKSAHLPYLVYLRNPTTGGVFASWGSLGHVTIAEPGALVGFLGPRVYEALYGEKFPEGVQTSENLYRNGVIDGVASTTQLRDLVDRALHVLVDSPGDDHTIPEPADSQDIPDVPAWQSVITSRRDDRPGVRELVRHASSTRVPLSGTGQARWTRPCCCRWPVPRSALRAVRSGSRGPVGAQHDGAAALREARRGMRMAAELRLPLVLVIDTLGAALSKEAEERGWPPRSRAASPIS